jgi:type VI protein secretion system component VasF
MIKTSTKKISRKRRAQTWARWLCSLGCVAMLVVATGVGLIRTQAQESFPLPAINPPGAKASPPATPAAPAQAAGQPTQPQAGAGDASTPDVAKQCSDLLKMATDLKAAVDKTSAGTLSVTVVRKAGEIEQLAHKVRIANAKY